jgi:ornithine decarboxylase
MKIYSTNNGLRNGLQLLSGITKINTGNRWIYDNKTVYNQITNWQNQIPWIKPYYAMKSNPSSQIINDIVSHPYTIGLDVASMNELNLALIHTNNKNIIYTNPHIINHELEQYKTKTLNVKVIDSIGELKKILTINILPKILIRMKSNNTLGNTCFDTKFGASHSEIIEILEYSKQHNIKINGISFHIGSGGDYDRSLAYYMSYLNAKPYLEYIKTEMKIKKPILNIGGGLLYNTDLYKVLGWTKVLPYEIIAEPGRYFSEPSFSLIVQIIAITSNGIFLDNGIYHELNCYQRDHWKFPDITQYMNNNTDVVKVVKKYKMMKVFGPTCDSEDTLDMCRLPINIQVGDWIILPNMGAYTSAGITNFNGIYGASHKETLLTKLFTTVK